MTDIFLSSFRELLDYISCKAFIWQYISATGKFLHSHEYSSYGGLRNDIRLKQH